MQDARQVLDPFDEVVVLRAMPRDADRVAFLESVRADEMVGTWPVTQTMGTEFIIASVSPVTAFVAPGPDVTRTTPTLPEDRA